MANASELDMVEAILQNKANAKRFSSRRRNEKATRGIHEAQRGSIYDICFYGPEGLGR